MSETLTLEQVEAELAVTAQEIARRSLLTFTSYTFQDYEINWHHRVLAHTLDRVLSGELRRVICLMPPQNGKSELVSRRFPAYAFGRRPDVRIVACSYSASLAQDMSRDVQKVMDTPEYKVLFPDTRLASPRDIEVKTQGQFQIVGRRGHYVAAGVDGPITGKSADIGIVDDPFKNRAEADSETYRDNVWNWFTSTFATRQFGGDGAIIVVLTRWHEDDLAGRLLKMSRENPEAEQWTVVEFPAISEGPLPHDPRQVGEALWPAKYSLEELRKRRITMGAYDWSSLYQQRPAPVGGGLFRREWFKVVEALPAQVARRVRGWDTAGTEGGGDHTVGVKISEAASMFYVEDVVRGQWGPGGVDKNIKLTAALDGKACGQREEKEGGSAGVAVVAARVKALAGYDYAGVQISGSKVTRCKPFRAQCEAGNVYLLRGAWNEAYIQELCGFPTATHDDQVDGSSCAFNSLLLEPVQEEQWATW
jgi:predicted phage terminase large subunit-like protein